MKIAIIGYGKLGHMIESTALNRNHEIGSKIDLGDDRLMEPENLKKQVSRPQKAPFPLRRIEILSNIP